MSQLEFAEPVLPNYGQTVFHFISYDKVIGNASNLKELLSEMRRLEYEDPRALTYHLVEGHIGNWLRSINEKELAEELRWVRSVRLAIRIVEEYLDSSVILSRMRRGRMH